MVLSFDQVKDKGFGEGITTQMANGNCTRFDRITGYRRPITYRVGRDEVTGKGKKKKMALSCFFYEILIFQ
jgi:hypothetical protein